ncbi:MAG: mechanosensitive ion channel family protein, partial [Candidatus Omnitrophica bacterium]|nr:mechanosensitive ion channel family protein [Candidatus Omnitrophota bacterium]
MNGELILVIQRSSEIIIPASVFLITVLVGYVLRRFLFARLFHWASRSSTKMDDIIIAATKGPFMIWCLMLGIYFALESSKLPGELVHLAGKIILILGIISVTFVLANISVRLVKIYSGKLDTAIPVTSLTQNITRIIIFGVGILIILNTLGISITPILATLGVGGLAVALALQDTLSNLFSGFHIVIAKQIRIGDYIKLDSG